MKKPVTVFIIVMLLCAASLSFATTVFADEILFRGIPWGSNYNYVESQAISEGDTLTSVSGDWVRTYAIPEILYGTYSRDETLKPNINLSAFGVSNLHKVAGYDLERIHYFFVFTEDGGILTRNKEDTCLYGGSYKFKLENPESAYHNITGKLVGLYGLYEETLRKDSRGNITDYIRTWNGDNNTLLMLRWDVSGSVLNHGVNLFMHYIWKDGDNLLKHASDIAEKMQLQYEDKIRESQSIDGL